MKELKCKIEKEKFKMVHFGFETFTYTWRWMNDIINPNEGRGLIPFYVDQ